MSMMLTKFSYPLVRPRPGAPPGRAARGGFSLIEVIGVLSIVAILVAVVGQSVLQNLNRSAREAEDQNMANIANALQASILRTKSVPSAANWVQVVSSELGLPPNKVSTTAAGTTRVLLIDPNCRIGTNASQTLPYTQTNRGSIELISPRFLLISSVTDPLPSLGIASNSASTFSNLWSTVPGTIPAIWATNWNESPEDVKFQRLDLSTLFSRVILENIDLTNDAPFSIEVTNSLTRVQEQSRMEMWFINSTILNFHNPSNMLIAREYVTSDVGYTFENGDWGRYVRQGLPPGASGGTSGSGWFGAMVDQFLAAPAPPGGTRRYSNQQWIVDAMFTFLWCFGQWSLDDFSGGPPWPHIPAYELSSAGAGGLCNYSSDLICY